MKYLKSFNKQLRFFRETHKLDHDDIAQLCHVDISVAEAWEQSAQNSRVYPSLENLLDICFKTGASLEYFLDIPRTNDVSQLELPGISSDDGGHDLNECLRELDQQLDAALPKAQEQELLKRFRKSDEQNKQLIMQLMRM